MIAEADISGDGRVDYSEFAHLWKTFLLAKHQKPAAGGRLQQVPFQANLTILVGKRSSVRIAGCRVLLVGRFLYEHVLRKHTWFDFPPRMPGACLPS